ncbi:MAG TPA: hypothetical protein VNA88_02340 [Candidatus Kapabacteria bacterium]|jgi:hypothetical protein|nr:hypothetical protein [Candidatus Kapabacteria bacterium]
MKQLPAIIGGLLLFCATATAQEHSPRTAEGDRALLFSINGFGDFGVRGAVAATVGASAVGDSGIGGATPIYGIGAKYFVAPRTALRASFGLGVSTRASDSGGGGGASSMALAIAPALEYHVVQSGPLTGYVGGFASYATRSSGSGGETSEYSTAATSISIGAMLGVEFFAWSVLSLGAEYQLGARFNSSSTTSAGTTTDAPGTTEVGIGTVAVRLGVYL